MLCLIYTHDTQGHAAPEGECVYIIQNTSACVIINMLHFWHSKNLPKLEGNVQLAYIVTDADDDSGKLFLPLIKHSYLYC